LCIIPLCPFFFWVCLSIYLSCLPLYSSSTQQEKKQWMYLKWKMVWKERLWIKIENVSV
jgi:hypothetical protein